MSQPVVDKAQNGKRMFSSNEQRMTDGTLWHAATGNERPPTLAVSERLPQVRGVATGGGISVYMGIYTEISLPYKFLCGYWLFCSNVGH